MKILKALGFAVLVAAPATASQAAVIYADEVESYTQGTGITSSARTIQANALGAADGKFLSLGIGGEAIFRFGQTVTGYSAVSIFETTFGDRDNNPEEVQVFGGLDGVFTLLGTLTNAGVVNVLNFVGTFNQIKLVDISTFPPSKDGYDIDAISVQMIPVPAAGLMLLSALGLVSVLRRRKA